MLIKYIKLKNIRSYINEEITFPNGSLLLSGDIGSGKSTILLAIEFALFGIINPYLSGQALLRKGESNGCVEACFEIGGKEIILKRTLKKTPHSVQQGTGYLVIDNIKYDLSAKEMKSKILDILGYPKEFLTKSKSLIYRYTVYTPQEEMKLIILSKPEERLTILRKIFGIDKYKKITENSAIILRKIKEKKKEY